MRVFFVVVLLLMILFSCNVDSDTRNEEIPKQIIQYNSFKEKLYAQGTSILDMEAKYDVLFERTGELSNNKDAYSDFFQRVADSVFLSFGHKLTFLVEDSLTFEEEDKIWDLYNTNYSDFLFRTCKEFQDQEGLSENQKSLLREFSFDSYKAKPDLHSIAKILSNMSEKEFQNDGIKQCCLFYIVDIFTHDLEYEQRDFNIPNPK